ncbi:nickel/cobalt transporter [Erwinia tasmaniensis]|uniref:Nickel/cobalt efflux system n=1 Tax=Erwinia tasmaniensis (strain DSM 17950 / CFBP 7177 / CIP 109463 / NCPPB 4357 / Et1/99) TaxID=465817 RepID=B2VI28_ERWT9|nr:nickel/cobalt transporter [Erwinia tasmaniensis]CAO96062.1 Putative membrane protein [Erwinia tasmaniensis Et1/99]
MSVTMQITRRYGAWFLLLALLAGGGLLLWQYWPQMLWQSALWQKDLHRQMTQLLQQVAENPQQAGLALMGFSLLYGILHALGPGHGKVIIATFLATHPTKMKTSLQLTLAAALVQGGIAIALVTLVLGILQLSARQLHLSSYWLEKGSYLLVIGLGLWLCWRALRKLALQRAAVPPSMKINRILPAGKQHGAHCGCGHQHVPDANRLAQAPGWQTKTMVVLSMGLRPCSGAIMMLLFSKVVGVWFWGVLSALVMAMGTALTVSAMALLVHLSRKLALRFSRDDSRTSWQIIVLNSLALLGGMVLVAVGALLWLSAQPAMSGGIRPMF